MIINDFILIHMACQNAKINLKLLNGSLIQYETDKNAMIKDGRNDIEIAYCNFILKF